MSAARLLLPLFLALGGAPAAAEELRDLCTSRPSLGTSACIVDKGHVVAELGVLDWTRDSDSTTREDTLLSGDLLLRLGVTEDAEIQLGWTAFGHVREKDRTTGAVDARSGTGDVTVTWRQNLRNPDGSGTSFGVQPFVSLSTGRQSIGAGDWGAGLVVPVSFELGQGIQLTFDPEADAEVDEDGNGRHLAYGNVTGVQVELTKKVAATLELSAFRDRDPAEHVTELLGALSFTWQPGDNLQFDAGAVAGLNHQSPDIRLLTGVSARF